MVMDWSKTDYGARPFLSNDDSEITTHPLFETENKD